MAREKRSRNALWFILLTILIDAVGFGLIVPVMPALLKELLGVSASEAAPWGGYLTFVYAAMGFLCGPAVGNLSDRFGRRPVLLASLAALACDYLIMGFATSVGVLFVGRLLSGICGATISTANAFIADVTSREERGHAFGLVGAAFGMGFILGPAFGGLLGAVNARAPFFAAAGLAMLNMAYGMFVLPESLPPDGRRPFHWQRAHPFGAFRHFARFPNVAWLLVVVLCFQFAHGVYPATWNFHADARYGWRSGQIGGSLMLFGVASACVQGYLIRLFLRRLGPTGTAACGLTFNIIAFLGYAFAVNAWQLYVWIPVAALGAIAGPAVNALMSTSIPPNAQGELQGVVASVQGVANMISPIVMTQVFSFFLSDASPVQLHGSAFLLAAVLSLTALVPFALGARRAPC